MKVLQKGNPNGWDIEQVCTGKGNGGGGCGARLLVSWEDIFLNSHYYINGTSNIYYYSSCPECGIKTDIPGKEIPADVKKKIKENN